MYVDTPHYVGLYADTTHMLTRLRNKMLRIVLDDS
jgi:hypothetical protein